MGPASIFTMNKTTCVTTSTIPQLLREEEINIIAIGNVIFETTKEYSQKVNDKLISPIATWLDDPDFLKRHKVRIDEEVPNWAEYKREQRNYNILIAQEALRLKREQDRHRKNYLKRIATLIPRSRGSPSEIKNTSAIDHVSPIVVLLSPQTKANIEIHQEFDYARDLPITLKYPWQTILSRMVTEPTTFESLPTICSESPKSDKAAKLSTLLQMETESLINIEQIEPFGKISISPQGIDPDSSVIIKNKYGIEKKIYWNSLSDDERADIIAEIKANRIVCIEA
jgi:chromatin segregation and condensation protein Rec8/ScpA/Scc1 (kleisin family)